MATIKKETTPSSSSCCKNGGSIQREITSSASVVEIPNTNDPKKNSRPSVSTTMETVIRSVDSLPETSTNTSTK
ncbi:hypothetical protein MKW98_000641, partial [Papaver atlanticum]